MPESTQRLLALSRPPDDKGGGFTVVTRGQGIAARFLWATGGQLFGQAAAAINIWVIARTLGLAGYGSYVMLLVALAAGTFAWNTLVLEAVANAFARDLQRAAWHRYLATAAAVGASATAVVVLAAGGGRVNAAVLVLATAGEALFIRAKPMLLAEGQQRRIALGATVEQSIRVVAVVVLAVTGSLSPAGALVAQALGYVAGAVVHGPLRGQGTTPLPRLRGVIGAEALRWLERYPPLLGAAVGVGLVAAGGFDLLLRILAFAIFALQMTGVIVLPEMQHRLHAAGPSLIARALRLPTLLGIVTAVVFALFGGHVVRLISGSHVSFGLVPVVLAGMIVVAPFSGIVRVTLHTCDARGWIFPAQAVLAFGALLSAAAMTRGFMLAAALLTAGHIAGALVLALGLRSTGFSPPARELLSSGGAAGDVRRLFEARR